MEDLYKAAKAILKYDSEEGIYDTSSDDGDGYVDEMQSNDLQELLINLQIAVNEAAPMVSAMETIKEGFIVMVQTAIARQTQQPGSSNRE